MWLGGAPMRRMTRRTASTKSCADGTRLVPWYAAVPGVSCPRRGGGDTTPSQTSCPTRRAPPRTQPLCACRGLESARGAPHDAFVNADARSGAQRPAGRLDAGEDLRVPQPHPLAVDEVVRVALRLCEARAAQPPPEAPGKEEVPSNRHAPRRTVGAAVGSIDAGSACHISARAHRPVERLEELAPDARVRPRRHRVREVRLVAARPPIDRRLGRRVGHHEVVQHGEERGEEAGVLRREHEPAAAAEHHELLALAAQPRHKVHPVLWQRRDIVDRALPVDRLRRACLLVSHDMERLLAALEEDADAGGAPAGVRFSAQLLRRRAREDERADVWQVTDQVERPVGRPRADVRQVADQVERPVGRPDERVAWRRHDRRDARSPRRARGGAAARRQHRPRGPRRKWLSSQRRVSTSLLSHETIHKAKDSGRTGAIETE
eukprot:4673496-Prymnesium_polylepis.2